VAPNDALGTFVSVTCVQVASGGTGVGDGVGAVDELGGAAVSVALGVADEVGSTEPHAVRTRARTATTVRRMDTGYRRGVAPDLPSDAVIARSLVERLAAVRGPVVDQLPDRYPPG